MKCILNAIMEITYITSKNSEATNKNFRVIDDFEHLKEYQNDLGRQWVYKNDKWLGVRNHISPPPIAVTETVGDCDDFASHMYQVSQKYNPLLLTYFPRNIFKAHTVTVLKPTSGEWKGYYVLINWGRLNFFTTKQEVIQNLEGYASSKFISFHWAQYDYGHGRYRSKKDNEV